MLVVAVSLVDALTLADADGAVNKMIEPGGEELGADEVNAVFVTVELPGDGEDGTIAGGELADVGGELAGFPVVPSLFAVASPVSEVDALEDSVDATGTTVTVVFTTVVES